MNLRNTELPFVSIIIPVFNDNKMLSLTLTMLKKQDYPLNKFEVIVVDNGSNESEWSNIKKYSGIISLRELKYLNSPYSARNRGLEIAKGSVVVFLDASCIPEFNWLSEGIKYMHESGSDLVAGKVLFDVNNKSTNSELFDSLVNIDMEGSVKKGAAKTANLFVKKEVINKIGVFPESIRSGGDIRWTGKAINDGFVLSFCQRSVVRKKARGFSELINKQWRVALYKASIWNEQNKRINLVKIFFEIFIPSSFSAIRRMIKERGYEGINYSFIHLWSVRCIIKFIMNWGIIYGFLTKKGFKKKTAV